MNAVVSFALLLGLKQSSTNFQTFNYAFKTRGCISCLFVFNWTVSEWRTRIRNSCVTKLRICEKGFTRAWGCVGLVSDILISRLIYRNTLVAVRHELTISCSSIFWRELEFQALRVLSMFWSFKTQFCQHVGAWGIYLIQIFIVYQTVT